MRMRWISAVAAVVLTGVAGVGVTAGLQQGPAQDARPADPIGDLMRASPPSTPVEPAPTGAPAPAAPVVLPPPADVVVELAEKAETPPEEAAKINPPAAEKIVEPDVPVRRQRRRVAVIEAIDKITAQSMRFEVEVGGRPVRFSDNLIFSVRACEVSTPSELVEDSIAYVDISLEPRGTNKPTGPRQLFRGWMFASTPGVSGLQHPIYDAWVVGCKA